MQAPKKQSQHRLSILVFYEDAAALTTAREKLETIKRRLGFEDEIDFSMWKFDFLDSPALRELAEAEASGADVLVVATTHQGPLHPNVKSWIKSWQPSATSPGRALAFIGAAQQYGTEEEISPACVELQQIANVRHLDFFAL